jgi:hypothetical protein
MPTAWLLFFITLFTNPLLAQAGTIRFTFGIEREIQSCEDVGDQVRYLTNGTWYVAKRSEVEGVAPLCGELPLLASSSSSTATKSSILPTQTAPSSSYSSETSSSSTAIYPQGQSSPAEKSVPVRGYTRKDGTYVPAHTRSAPGASKRR